MKTYRMLWSVLLLLIFSATANAFNIKIYPDHQRIFIAHGTTKNVIAESEVLGYKEKSIAIGTWNATVGAWVIPTANKDGSVHYAVKDAAGVYHWLNTCPNNITATSGHVDTTNVVENADCTVSYRYKGIAKTTPKVSFANGFLSGDVGTNIFYAIQSAHLKLNQVGKVEWNSDQCGWNGKSRCVITPTLNAKGNIVFSLKAPSNDPGTLSVTSGTSRYWFSLGNWTNGTGVTKVGNDRLRLGVAFQGIMSYTGTTTKIFDINMMYDWLPTVPVYITNIKGCVVSNRLGFDYRQTDTNAYNNGICVNPSMDSHGNMHFLFINAKINDELPVDLLKNDDLSLVVIGMDGTTPKTFGLPIADFKQGIGVTLDKAKNRIRYGGYAKPSITVNKTAHTMRVAFNVDGFAPLVSKVAPKKSIAKNVQFLSSTSWKVFPGVIQKDANGYLYANISGLPNGDCGYIAVELNGTTEKAFAFGLNEDVAKSIWTLKNAVKGGTIGTDGNGNQLCF